MKRDNKKEVMNALIMVFQFGINMIVPIFLCTLAGVWIGKKTGADWVTVPLFFLGAFAGANNIYRMVQKFLKPEDDGRAVRHFWAACCRRSASSFPNTTRGCKRNDLIPDSITYGVENEPVLTYGTVKVSMGSLEFLTQKVERLAKIKPQLQGMEGTLHLENWTEETTNIVFDKMESSKKDNKKS